MYNYIKRTIKALLPDRFLFRVEPLLRKFYYQFYRGDRYYCSLCRKKLHKFVDLKDGDRLCPFCGSLSRTRRLWEILNSGFLKQGITILDFSPHRALYHKLKNDHTICYHGTDISGNFLSDFQYDITNIDTEDETFDLIICYHILEHVESDIQAMNELYRVLKKGGSAIIQTPFKEGEIFENPEINSETERLRHFGQEDHVRIYSAEGLKKRLISCGFKVNINHYTDMQDSRPGLNTTEKVLICTK
ncbi:MAG: class I SAM-dependent methyltransferase [Bacteroidales bacterium]